MLRVVLGQPGVRAPIGAGSIVLSSEVARIETARALDRLRVGGSLDDSEHAAKSASANALLGTFHLIPLADEIVEAAREKYPIEVGALSAIHVATAQVLLADVDALQFWTYLPSQALAAIARGLDVRGAVIRA